VECKYLYLTPSWTYNDSKEGSILLRKFFNSLFFVFLLSGSDALLADTPPNNPPSNTPTPPTTATPEEIAALREENKRLKDEAEKRNKKPDDDKDLTDRVREQREADEKKNRESKGLESALRFNLTSDRFISENKEVLPKDMADIFSAAEKESYDSPIEKANATKSALIQSFFSLQANVDLLTPSQRDAIEDFNKLTKKGKEEKAQDVYQNIFEPTLGMIKQIKKAEEVGKSKGHYPNESEADAAYREKLMSGSKKHFLGEKS